MPNISDLKNTTLSSYNHIDALLDHGPDWNYQTTGGNTISYTFSIASGLEPKEIGQVAFTAAQMSAARAAMAYVASITGINFVETSIGTSAQVHFCMQDIPEAAVSGLCSWYASTGIIESTGELKSYSANAYIYLDNKQFASQNSTLAEGTVGYETLLHEIGHMLGLKHPFEGQAENPAVLNPSIDNSANTIMSYEAVGGPYSKFSPYDIAALNWIYGRDGIGGALGINAAGRYLTGTSGADVLRGGAGNDVLSGEAGVDVVQYNGARAGYTLQGSTSGFTAKSIGSGTDSLTGVERIMFADKSVAIDIDGTGGIAYRLYRAAFDRIPDQEGVGFWMTKMDRGTSVESVADGFIKSAEFVAMYGANSTNVTFVTKLYEHVLHRPADGPGFDFWVNALTQGVTRVDVLNDFSESAENIAQVIGSIQNGFEYIPYTGV